MAANDNGPKKTIEVPLRKPATPIVERENLDTNQRPNTEKQEQQITLDEIEAKIRKQRGLSDYHDVIFFAKELPLEDNESIQNLAFAVDEGNRIAGIRVSLLFDIDEDEGKDIVRSEVLTDHNILRFDHTKGEGIISYHIDEDTFVECASLETPIDDTIEDIIEDSTSNNDTRRNRGKVKKEIKSTDKNCIVDWIPYKETLDLGFDAGTILSVSIYMVVDTREAQSLVE